MRGLAQVGAVVAVLAISEKYNRGVSRTLRALKRGITAAVAAYIEDRGGIKLFTLEDEELELVTPATWQLPDALASRRRLLERQAAGSQGSGTPPVTPRNPSGSHAEEGTSGEDGSSADGAPSFLETTKFFSCLDLQESRQLYQHTTRVVLKPQQELFRAGDPSDGGIYIVVEGRLGVFLPQAEGAGGPGELLLHTSTLVYGESVGDLDVIDGGPRTMTCVALEEGCTLVQVPRALFLRFVLECPKALQIYLQKAIGRLWRVAHFVLTDFLDLPLESLPAPPPAASPLHSLLSSQLSPLLPVDDALPLDGAAQANQAAQGSSPDSRQQPAQGRPGGDGESSPPAPTWAAVAAGKAATATQALGPLGAASVAKEQRTLLGGGTPHATHSAKVEGRGGQAEEKSRQAGSQAEPAAAVAAAAARDGLGKGILRKGGQGPSRLKRRVSFDDLLQLAGQQAQQQEQPAAAGQMPAVEGEAAPALESAAVPASKGPSPGTGRHSAEAAKAALEVLPSVAGSSGLLPWAGLAGGWDVVAPEESGLSQATWERLRGGVQAAAAAGTADGSLALEATDFGRHVVLSAGQVLHEADEGCRHFYVLLEGSLVVESADTHGGPKGTQALVAPGSLLCCAAFLSSARTSSRCWAGAGEDALLAAFGPAELDLILAEAAEILSPPTSPRLDAPDEEQLLLSPFGLVAEQQQQQPSSPRRPPALKPVRSAARQPAGDGSEGPPSPFANPQGVDQPPRQPPTPPKQAQQAALPPRPPRRRQAILRSMNSGALADAELLRVGSLHTSGPLPTLTQIQPSTKAAGPATARQKAALATGPEAAGLDSAAAALPAAQATAGMKGSNVLRAFAAGNAAVRRALGLSPAPAPLQPLLEGESLPGSPRTPASPGAGEGAGPAADASALPGSEAAVVEVVEDGPGREAGGAAKQTHQQASKDAAATAGGAGDTKSSAKSEEESASGNLKTYSSSQEQQQQLQDGCSSDESNPGTAAAAAFVDLMLAAGRALGPVIRRALSLGFSRTWLHAGDIVYRQGEPAENMYLVISGRCKLLHYSPRTRSLATEDEVGRGDSMGAVWALSGGAHDASCLCTRDSELVRMNKAAFEALAARYPRAAARVLQGMAERMAASSVARRRTVITSEASPKAPLGPAGKRRGEIVTIALVPAGSRQPGASAASAAVSVSRLARALRATLESMWGATLLLNSAGVGGMFPTAFERLNLGFYRGKITAWMAAQEEEYRFILLQADPQPTPWSRICTSQADCILLVADPHSTRPQVSPLEEGLVWSTLHDAESLLHPHHEAMLADWEEQYGWGAVPDLDQLAAAGGGTQAARAGLNSIRRVELVLVHEPGQTPSGTAAWLAARPHLTRHHHIRPSNAQDLARLSRWAAGAAVGVVLSGGGSRGLAHLGVLWALDDAGVPVDVVGGTSQGAFMAALHAQGLPFSSMQAAVRNYAAQMANPVSLLWDLTLPLISVFTGSGFDAVVREALSHGPQRIEDLWHKFFCVSTNLSKGAPSVHETGLLWKLVRASMTIVGLVPPVYEEGDLLVDGGYLNNIPVDVMRSLGVGTVIVVDVEDRDQSAWHDLTPYDGGLSGWQLLWDRWCPIPAWRYNYRIPKYNQLVNALTWMSHMQNLRRVSRDFVIDLYLRPPVTHFKLMDYHLMDRIVRDSTRYAWAAVSEWQSRVGIHLVGPRGPTAHLPSAGTASPALMRRRSVAGPPSQRWRRSHSISCMSQLQSKAREAEDAGDAAAEEEEEGAEGELSVPQLPREWNPYDIDEAGTKNLSDQSPLMSIDEVEHQRKRTRQGQEDAKDAAIKLLAGRPHTQKELRSKLLEKGFSMEVIKNAVDRLQELGLQSDREFAEVFVRSKWRTSKWGPAKLQLELSRRGVAKQHIDAAVQQQFGDGLQVGTHIEDLTLTFHPEDGGPGSSGSAHAARLHGSSSPPPAGQGQLGAAADPAGALLAEARRQFERSRGLSGDTRKRRLDWQQPSDLEMEDDYVSPHYSPVRPANGVMHLQQAPSSSPPTVTTVHLHDLPLMLPVGSVTANANPGLAPTNPVSEAQPTSAPAAAAQLDSILSATVLVQPFSVQPRPDSRQLPIVMSPGGLLDDSGDRIPGLVSDSDAAAAAAVAQLAAAPAGPAAEVLPTVRPSRAMLSDILHGGR
ncbi:hypothetical protein N2152v2_007218 [Parachlorella kessleri]